MKKVTILFGGTSAERDVSLRSGAAVIAAAKMAGFVVQAIDVKDENVVEKEALHPIVLPVLHGTYGEDGTVQEQLKKRSVRFLGSDSEVSKNCFDKTISRDLFRKNNIPIALGSHISSVHEYKNSSLRQAPHVIKIAHGGSSIGTLIIRNPKMQNNKAIAHLFKLDSKVVLEELIEGIELTVPVLGEIALPVIEIMPPQSQEFDYKNKYNGATKEICPPSSLSREMQVKAQDIALKVHNAMGCRHLSRVDMILSPSGQFTVLEINTMPGLTEQSLFPLSAREYGLELPELVRKFVLMTEQDTK